jgi:predicted transcriptional regulator YdeE
VTLRVAYSIAVDSEKEALADYRSLREIGIEAYPDGDTDSEEYLCEIRIAITKK